MIRVPDAVIQTGPGYDNDPYAGETGEDFFMGKLFWFTGKDGFCSTAREWHIFLAGITAGLKAKTLENVPDCPPLWVDEMQYFNTPAMIVNVIKCQWPSIVVVITSLTTALASGFIKIG